MSIPIIKCHIEGELLVFSCRRCGDVHRHKNKGNGIYIARCHSYANAGGWYELNAKENPITYNTEIGAIEMADNKDNGQEEKQELSDAAKKKLFLAAIKADKALRDFRDGKSTEEIKLATETSIAVLELSEKVGNGPWIYKGNKFSVGHKGDTYYLKRHSSVDVEVMG